MFRVSCFDCLNRTNVVMTKIGILGIESILNHVEIDLENEIAGEVLANIDIYSPD